MRLPARLTCILLTLFSMASARAEFPQLKESIQKNFTSASGQSFSILSGWTVNPETGEDVLGTQLSFRGVFKAKEVRWMQIARVQTNDDKDYVFQGFQEDRNKNRTANGYYLDQNYDICKDTIEKCSYFFRDHFTNPDESVEIDNLSQLADFPFGWSQFKRISLESCAYNLKTSKYEGCILWGAEWPPVGDRKLLETKFQAAPSSTFFNALTLFKTFYHLK